jgi:hypothetical protein
VGRATRIVVGALNIAASPHPSGIYQRLFELSAETPIHLAGSDWAKITKVEPRGANVLFGRILVWTEIDKNASWLNTTKNKEATADEKDKIAIPEDIRPNFKGFYFAINTANHLLLVEFRNEFGHSFGSKRAERFFSELLNLFAVTAGIDGVEVTAIPEDDSVDRILRMFSLRHLKIVLIKPNPDINTSDVNRVLNKLAENKARKQILELVKEARAPTLTPDEDTRKLAMIASTNGYVEGQGKDKDGRQLTESTKEHPKRVSYVVGDDQSSEVQFISRLTNFSPVAGSTPGDS